MGAGQSADIPGGGSEGYHVLRVISRSIYFAPLFYTAVVEKLIYHGLGGLLDDFFHVLCSRFKKIHLDTRLG